MKIKRILVTGSSGFIGRHLCKKLENIGIELVINATNGNVPLDVTNYKEVMSIKEEVEGIIHLAAKTSVSGSFGNPFETYYVNLLGTLNMLEFAKKKNVRVFVYNSTYVYGQPKYIPIDESHPVNPHSPYNLSKFIGEQLCMDYSASFGLNVVTLRPFYVYGPHCKEGRLIPSILRQIEGRKGRILLSGRKIKRDFLFISDFVELVMKILGRLPSGYNMYNVGTGKSNTLEEVAEIIATLTNRKMELRYHRDKRTREITDMVADISKVKRGFNWTPKFSLDDGLEITLKQSLAQ
jgi:UDP-glucose 4-epimerase